MSFASGDPGVAFTVDGTLIVVGSVSDDTFGGGQLRIWLSDDAHTRYPADIPADQQIVPMGARVAANDDRIVVLAIEFTQRGPGNPLA